MTSTAEHVIFVDFLWSLHGVRGRVPWNLMRKQIVPKRPTGACTVSAPLQPNCRLHFLYSMVKLHIYSLPPSMPDVHWAWAMVSPSKLKRRMQASVCLKLMDQIQHCNYKDLAVCTATHNLGLPHL